MAPFTYEEMTLIGRSLEQRAEQTDVLASEVYRSIASTDPVHTRVSKAVRADGCRKHAGELRRLADKVWTVRRTLPDAPYHVTHSHDGEG